ncbi:uncharacterized protein LOC111800973 [Cucurbita pepo subsp. pepo]|uniref:uncharacterized protein LOC111800973 n=1 Tax=Cucurbita pepo subsp. pepo TaxID=3664 RepID=UPI000C9D6749|nr:uncharacterized protein LOC111800973 [Cucurbita pepo subsp. pepo]
MPMPTSFFLALLFLSTFLHACDARLLKLCHSSRLESCLISPGFRTNQLERSLDESKSNDVSSMENVGIEILKGMKKLRRLAMELPVRDRDRDKDIDKVVNSEENEVGEDMVVMDYAQPHRKPPIHNQKP